MVTFNVCRSRPGSTRVEVAVMILVGLTATGSSVSCVRKVRTPAARTQSTNNLKNIGLSAHSFHDANKRLPFNGVSADTVQENVQYHQLAQPKVFCSGSWGFQISAYIDQGPMFEAGTATHGVSAFMEQSRSRPTTNATAQPWSDYLINPWLNDAKAGDFAINVDSKRTLEGIKDGTANTIFFGIGAVNTRDYGSTAVVPGYLDTILKGGTGATAQTTNRMARDASDTPRDATRGWGSPYAQGCLFCMGDATVRMFPYALNDTGLQPFLTPTGKEEVVLPDT